MPAFSVLQGARKLSTIRPTRPTTLAAQVTLPPTAARAPGKLWQQVHISFAAANGMRQPLSSARSISIFVRGALAWAALSDNAALSLIFHPCSRRNSKNVKRAAVLCPSLVCSRWLVLPNFPTKTKCHLQPQLPFGQEDRAFCSSFLGNLSTRLAKPHSVRIKFYKTDFPSTRWP